MEPPNLEHPDDESPEYPAEVDAALLGLGSAGSDLREIAAQSGMSRADLLRRLKVLDERRVMSQQFHRLPPASSMPWPGPDEPLPALLR